MSIKLTGSTSGSIEVDVPAAVSGGDISLTLPNGVGSAEQFLKNSGTAGVLEYSSMVETSTGVGIGTSSPAVKAHISNTYTAPTGGFDGNIFLAVTNNSSSSNAAGIALSAGATGAAFIHFGDTDDANVASVVYDNDDNSMRFTTNASERFRIDSTGQALFFTSGNPITSGTSQGAGTTHEVFTGVHSRSSTTSGGTVCIKVFSNGNIQNTNNSYGQISDVKLKENIVNANSQWDDIKDIQVRNFNFKEETGNPTHTQIGVVAQELETVSPGLVYETPDVDAEGNDLGTVTKSVNYSVLYMKAVKALQEAQTRIEALETKVAALEAA